MFTTYPHSQYYRDRTSERELCCDFPGDELFIRGLRAMELHLARYNGYVHIPVVRVMNTVHRAICILLHGNSGYEQADYDQAIHQALGQERLLTSIAMVTLIAILRRTDGQRAKQCRSMLMDDRSEDFYEGLELYERLIGPTELRLNEEDFLTDVMRQITDLQNTVQQLTNERQQLKNQLQAMSKTKSVHIGYNVEQMTINMSGGTLVQHADLVQAGGEVTVQRAEREETYISIPAPGKYSDVRRYIEQRKLNEPEFKTYCETHSRTELCQRLSKEFGWVVDDHSLGRNINRNK